MTHTLAWVLVTNRGYGGMDARAELCGWRDGYGISGAT